MRFVLPLVALCAFSSAPLRADIFNITLTGLTPSGDELDGSGTFTTDGICTTCTPGAGLLSLTIDIGRDSGMDAFDISDDNVTPGSTEYIRPLNLFNYFAHNSETGDILSMQDSTWALIEAPNVTVGTGTYSVALAPEPNSLFLLMPVVALLGLRWRHQRHRV
jgi:hypothetical protein